MLRQPRAQFRGNQLAVLQAIARGETPLVQVCGTGGGKSLSFLLPAYCSPGSTTVVITPFLALQGNLYQRAQESAIATVAAASEAFQGMLLRLQHQRQLDRLVLDEAHYILNSSYTFQPALRSIGTVLGQAGTQLVLLTATLPPRDEAAFSSVLHLPPALVRMHRQPTRRANLAYHVRIVASDEAIATAILQHVQAVSPQSSSPRTKAIIYCSSIELVQFLAEQLGCPAYHHQAAGGYLPAKLAIL
ncbi:hypothetical protein GQ53DRAFT_834923 [Thozetella sp. PMI_491]|nr:hypothetical protein GQ53DRAFT_834923 [Thozetella sp. PMI_491]